MKLKIYSVLGSAILLGTAVIAQPQKNAARKIAAAPAALQTQSQAKPDGTVFINSPSPTIWDDKREVGHLTEKVTVSQQGEDFILYCDDLKYYKKNNQATARVNLRVESKDSTITGNLIQADFNAKLLIITGNVVMNSHGSNDGIKGSAPNKKRKLPAQIQGKASTMTCNRIVYNYESKEAEVTGNIRMIQGENSGTCDKIIFDETNNRAKLIGKVHFIDKDGQTFRTPDLTFWIDDDLIKTGATDLEIPKKADAKVNQRPKTTWEAKPSPLEDIPDVMKEADTIQPADKSTVNTQASTPRGNATPAQEKSGAQDNKVQDNKVVDEKKPTTSPVEEDKSTDDTAKSKATKTAQRDG